MSLVAVPVPEAAKLLGLPSDSSKETVERALEAYTQNLKTAAQNDGRAVAAAIIDGRIPEARGPFWLNALAKDPSGGARSLLASLASYRPSGRATRRRPSELDTVLAKVTGRSVSASGQDDLGAITVVREIASHANTEHRVSEATDEQLNAYIEADPNYHRAVWEISKGGAGGLAKPPTQYVVSEDYEKPWDPKPKLVDNGDGTGAHWENQVPDPETLGVQGPRPQAAFNWPTPRGRSR